MTRCHRSRCHQFRRRNCRNFAPWLLWRCLRRSYRSFRLRFFRRCRNRRFRCRTRRGMFGGFLQLRDGTQHISWPRDSREVDLGLDAFVAGRGARSLRRTRHSVGASSKMFPHQVRFVIFQRTGMRLLLRNTHRGQYVKNFPALDLQLTGQIVDSNLAHPLSFPLLVPVMPLYLDSHV